MPPRAIKAQTIRAILFAKARIAKLRGQHLAVAEAAALGGDQRDVHALQHSDEAFAFDRSPDHSGVARIERIEARNVEDAGAVKPGFHRF